MNGIRCWLCEVFLTLADLARPRGYACRYLQFTQEQRQKGYAEGLAAATALLRTRAP